MKECLKEYRFVKGETHSMILVEGKFRMIRGLKYAIWGEPSNNFGGTVPYVIRNNAEYDEVYVVQNVLELRDKIKYHHPEEFI